MQAQQYRDTTRQISPANIRKHTNAGLRQLPSECGTHSGPVLRKKDINRCTSLRVLPCSWTPRSNRRNNPRSLRTFPPEKTTCFSLLMNPRMHRPQREGTNNSRQLVLIGARYALPSESFLSFFFFLPSCSRVRPQRIRRAQR